MKIYKVTKEIKNGDGFLSSMLTSKNTFWTLSAPDDAEIVTSEKACVYYNTLYAIEHDTGHMPIGELLKVMFEELSSSEAEKICDTEKWIGEKFNLYIQNPLNDKQFRESINNNDAEALATAAFVTSVLK